MSKDQILIEEEIRKLEKEKIFLERKLSETDYKDVILALYNEIENLNRQIFNLGGEMYSHQEKIDDNY